MHYYKLAISIHLLFYIYSEYIFTPLSRAYCACPDPYHSIAEFQVAGRI